MKEDDDRGPELSRPGESDGTASFHFTDIARSPCCQTVDDAGPNPPSQKVTPLEQFRGPSKRRDLHPLEVRLLWFVSAHLVFLPWAFGGMRLWGQIVSLIFAGVGFAVAMTPRIYARESDAEGPYRISFTGKLLRFPLFWLGLALLVYVALQGLNPSWVYQTDGKVWWMKRLNSISWLPTGVSAPFQHGGGPWRALVIYASAWLTMCTIWVGFTRRRSVRILFIVIATNGVLLSAFGLIQRLLPNGKIFWLWESSNDSFFSSFIYKNHAAAYLNLCLAVTSGLAAWSYLRGLRRLQKSNPAGLYVFFALVIAMSVFVSYSRGAAIAMMVFACLAATGFAIHQWFTPNASRRPLVIICLAVILGLFLKIGLESLDAAEAWSRINHVFSGEDTSVSSRKLATTASLDMYGAYWVRGTGAGGFRYLFPTYQSRYPEIYKENGHAVYWEHAHNDIVEFPIELGLFGVLLVLAAGIWWMQLQLRSSFWKTPLGLLVIMGGGLTVIHAWGDFLFQCPAILVLWGVLFVAIALWSRFESRRGSA